MHKKFWVVIAVLLLAVPAMAQDKITIKPIIGGSFGSVQRGPNEGVSRVSYWGGVFTKQLTRDIALWTVVQRTKLEDLNLTGTGGKILFTVAHKEYTDWTLLLGGGWLSEFALDGDGSRTAAFTFDMGMMYEWLWDQVYIGALGSAVDYGPRFDWSLDIGAAVMF
jgi:hypothetical protein